jgi:hypothetical protein
MNESELPASSLPRVLIWAARISGIVMMLFLLATYLPMFAEPGEERGFHWLYLLFLPVGVCLGYVLGWRCPIPGSVVSLVSVVLAFLWMVVTGTMVTHDLLIAIAFYAALALPGALFVIGGLAQQTKVRSE